MRCRQTLDISERCLFPMMHPAKVQAPYQLCFVETSTIQWGRAQPLNLRCEMQSSIARDVMERLDAKAVARAEEFLRGFIPNRERPHPNEALNA